ncbi:MAG: hypothetical protein HC819_21450 [Cyclobacteriaceae bacterium]|nr:hypothetical protein [Cyclobacteriaceae bacterium]
MNPKEINRDPFVKSLFDEAGMAEPNSDFTLKIIKKIEADTANKAFVHRPVIGRRAWLLIALFGLAMFVYLWIYPSADQSGTSLFGYALQIDISFIEAFIQKIAISFTISPILKTALLALVFFTFTNLIIFEWKSRSFFK